MDLQPTPFPGKAQFAKHKSHQKSSEVPKIHVKEPPLHREKRVFGTARNLNITAKSVPERAKAKPSSGAQGKAAKRSSDVSETPKKLPNENGERTKKTVSFQEKVDEKREKTLAEGNASGAQTPLRSPFLMKARGSGTPFLSAEQCSKCRFDKLETSSYWLAQIKLAESVGKHFASSAFFKLALESRAEPVSNMKVELKKYLARHEHLSTEEDWKVLSIGYGLLKEESKLCKEENEEECKTGLSPRNSVEEKNFIDQASKEDGGGEES